MHRIHNEAVVPDADGSVIADVRLRKEPDEEEDEEEDDRKEEDDEDDNDEGTDDGYSE
jgi:hypothetical protein